MKNNAVGHFWHRVRLQTSKEGTQGLLCSGPLTRRRIMDPGAGCHLNASVTGGSGHNRPDNDGPWELDGVLCHHRKYHSSTKGPEGFQDGRPRWISKEGARRGVLAKCKAFRGGTGNKPGGYPRPSCMPLMASDKDRVMAEGASVENKRDGTGCAEMARCPLPEIWYRAPRPTQIMWRLQRRLIHMPRPWL